MKQHLIVFAVAAASIVACSNSTAPADAGSYDKIEVLEEGGIAALSMDRLVNHNDRSYAYSQRHLCSTTCGAPSDSASGTLSAAATDSLFAVVAAADPFSLRDDYGTTTNAADMMSYTLRVTLNQNTKIIHADDGTMPPAMHQIVDALHATISAARQ